jgi:hypothetical protein
MAAISRYLDLCLTLPMQSVEIAAEVCEFDSCFVN